MSITMYNVQRTYNMYNIVCTLYIVIDIVLYLWICMIKIHFAWVVPILAAALLFYKFLIQANII